MKFSYFKKILFLFVLSFFFSTTLKAQDSLKTFKQNNVSQDFLKKCVGTYLFNQNVNEGNVRAEITLIDGKLFAVQLGPGENPPLELIPLSKTKFKISNLNAEIKFTTDRKGNVVGLVYTRDKQVMQASKNVN